jgi:hypothetical protein
MTEKRQTSQGYIIRILQHFATKLRNITNFVMLFQAVMKFLSRLVSIKISLKRGKVSDYEGRRRLSIRAPLAATLWLMFIITEHMQLRWKGQFGGLSQPTLSTFPEYPEKTHELQ